MRYTLFIVFMSFITTLYAQGTPTPEPLYGKEPIPFSKLPYEKLDEYNAPRIYSYAEDVSKDIVFLIIPGGGYAHVAMGHEGLDVARRLNEADYPAYVLYYRLPNDSLMSNRKFVPLQDAVRALDIIRERHPQKKIAVLGFSAGGHLTATLSNFHGNELISSTSPEIPKICYSILAYPVISMESDITHRGSKHNLIGQDASQTDITYFSTQKKVSSKTPPTFIMHAKDDKAVLVENTLSYVDALKKHHIAHHLFLYDTGGHGFGLKNPNKNDDWFEKMLSWIKNN